MRIAIINHGVFPFVVGGMERHSHFLASHMAEAGAEVEVVVPEMTAEQTAQFDAAGNPYRLVQFPWPPARIWLRSNYLFSRLAAPHLRAGGFDAVYCQGFYGWAYLADTPASERAFTLYNPHGLEMFKTVGLEQTLKTAPMRWAGREQARLADRTVSLGGGLTDEIRRFLKVPDDRIDILPNAVDLDYIDAFPTAPRIDDGIARFVFVGRLEFNKGVSYLCEAFEKLDGVHLTIVGGGPLEAELRARFAGPRIEFAGRLPDAELFARYHASDCFVFPSLYEGMPTVILEAMSCNLPVIATDIGAVREMVDRENGHVVAPRSAAQIGDAVKAFLALPREKRAALGTASRRKVETRFTWPQVARATLDTIERELTARGRPKA
jgi:glycosyltransferase involved in cell wall biosynthesis